MVRMRIKRTRRVTVEPVGIYPLDDLEYEDGVITSYNSEENTITSSERPGFITHLGEERPTPEPKPGDHIRFYEEGLGHPVRGVFINHRCLWYRTPEEEERQLDRMLKEVCHFSDEEIEEGRQVRERVRRHKAFLQRLYAFFFRI
jgi:hypothetical protein